MFTHSPLGLLLLGHGVVLRLDLAELAEDFADDVLELLEAVGADARHVVHHDDRLDPVRLLRPLLQQIAQQLCRNMRCT